MVLVLVMMLGFLALCGRSSREGRRCDLSLIELMLAGVFLLFAYGSFAG